MKRIILCVLTAALLLAGCGRQQPAPEPTRESRPETEPAAEVTTVPTAMPTQQETPTEPPENIYEMEFRLEGETERITVSTRYLDGCAIDIPVEEWEADADLDRWTSVYNPEVFIEVRHYDGLTPAEAAQRFAAESGFVFEDLMGGTSARDCLIGSRGYLLCCFFTADGGKVICWQYPLEAAEGFGSRMAQMAETFRMMW